MVGDGGVHCSHAGNVNDDDFGTVASDSAEQLFGQLARTLRVNDAYNRQDEQALANLQHWRRELANSLLLLTNNALSLLHEANCHRVRDTVCRWLVGIEDA